MKKNYLFGLLAMASMLFTACQEQDVVDASMANTEVVTFTVNTKQISTRTNPTGDGIYATNLYYGVYEKTGEDTWAFVPRISATTDEDCENVPAVIEGYSTDVNIRLVKQKPYKVVFWAEDSDNSMCNIDWNEFTLTTSPAAANQEAYDAFWAAEEITITGAEERTVILTRPFAQLNIGTSDFTAAKEAGMNVESLVSAITVIGVPTSMNILNGNVGDYTMKTSVAYQEAAIPTEENLFPVDGYEYLALNYVLVGADQSLVDIKLDYNDGDAYEYTFTSVPVRRNCRTNIYGELLTGNNKYNVMVDPDFGNPEDVEVVSVSTAQNLKEVVEGMGEGESLTIVLTDDINFADLLSGSNAPSMTRAADVNPSATLANGRTLILDLNGFTVTSVDDTEKNFGLIQNNGNLTINDSKGNGGLFVKATVNSGWNRYSAVISNNPGATLTVNGGTIQHLGGTDMSYGIDNLTNGSIGGVKCTINGGTIESTYRAVRQFLNSDSKDNELIINGGTLVGTNKSIFFHDPSTKANKGKLVVAADAALQGDVYLYVTEGSTEWPVEVSIAAAALQGESKVTSGNVPYGYNVTLNDGIYGIEYYLTDEGAEIKNLAALKWFRDQVNAKNTFEGKTIRLLSDIDLNNEQWEPIGYWETFNGTFDGGNHTISNLKHHGTGEDCYVGLFGYTENATIKNLTINNVDLQLVANNAWAGGHMGALIGNVEGNTNIENITITGDVKIHGDMEMQGAGRIGGVIGGNIVNAVIQSVHVNANEGSYIQGNSSIGGIAGQLQGEVIFKDCSTNIQVRAQDFCAGGIVGLTAKQTTFLNCATSGNVSVTKGREGSTNDLYRVGGIAGSWDDDVDIVLTLTDCSYRGMLNDQIGNTFDCGGFVGRGYSTVVGAKVSVNGVEYTYNSNGGYDLTIDGKAVYYISNVEELNQLNAKNAYVILNADIDFQGAAMTKPIELWGNSIFDGNGHTIRNVKTAVQGGYATSLFRGDANPGDKVIKNLVIDNLTTPSGYSYASAIWSDLQGANIEIDNVQINNATIEANGTIGGFVGFVSASTTSVVIKNSSINSSNLNGGEADHKRGAVVGRAYGCTVTCDAVEVNNVKINGEAATTTTLVGDKGYTGTVKVI